MIGHICLFSHDFLQLFYLCHGEDPSFEMGSSRKVTRQNHDVPNDLIRPKRGGYSYEMLRRDFRTHQSTPNYLWSALNMAQLDICGSYVFIPSVT